MILPRTAICGGLNISHSNVDVDPRGHKLRDELCFGDRVFFGLGSSTGATKENWVLV